MQYYDDDLNKNIIWYSIYEDGWKIKVDGKKKQLDIANIGFSGIYLDRGEHEIELYYVPKYLFLGVFISIAVLIFVLCVFMFDVFFKGKTKKLEY